MTDDAPVERFFELQRTTIEQTGEVLEQVVETSGEVAGELVGGVETQRDIQEQSLELTRESLQQSLDVVERVTEASSLGGVTDLRETVDATIDRLLDQQDSAFEAIEDSPDQLTEETLEQITDQTELLVEFNEELEQQLFEVVELLLDRAEEDGLADPIRVDHLIDQVETQVESVANLDDQFETIRVTGPDE
jgi:hypothetical protein